LLDPNSDACCSFTACCCSRKRLPSAKISCIEPPVAGPLGSSLLPPACWLGPVQMKVYQFRNSKICPFGQALFAKMNADGESAC
jgi:hypothetical protein